MAVDQISGEVDEGGLFVKPGLQEPQHKCDS